MLLDHLTQYLFSPKILKYQDGWQRGKRGGYSRGKGKNSTEEQSGTRGKRPEAI